MANGAKESDADDKNIDLRINDFFLQNPFFAVLGAHDMDLG